MGKKRLLILGLVAVFAGCGSSQKQSKDDEPTLAPESFAPAPESSDKRKAKEVDEAQEEEVESEATAGPADDISSGATICSSENCQKSCGAYSGPELERCFDAWKHGCFTSTPEEDHDCGSYSKDASDPTTGQIREKELPMNDL